MIHPKCTWIWFYRVKRTFWDETRIYPKCSTNPGEGRKHNVYLKKEKLLAQVSGAALSPRADLTGVCWRPHAPSMWEDLLVWKRVMRSHTSVLVLSFVTEMYMVGQSSHTHTHTLLPPHTADHLGCCFTVTSQTHVDKRIITGSCLLHQTPTQNRRRLSPSVKSQTVIKIDDFLLTRQRGIR